MTDLEDKLIETIQRDCDGCTDDDIEQLKKGFEGVSVNDLIEQALKD